MGQSGTAGAADAGLDKPGYTLTFHDEFDSGAAPDPSIYFYYYCWGDQNNPAEDPAFLQGDTVTAGRAGYVGDAQTISDGLLKITASNGPARYGGQTFPYRTGALRTRMAQLYGWFEVRAKIPAGHGYNPAFWLMPPVYNDSAIWEIDGFEAPSSASQMIYMNAHWGMGFDTPNHMQNLTTFAGDFSTDFHVFAISWQSDAIVWYVDGVERKRQTSDGTNVPPVAMQLLFDLDLGGSWAGAADSTTPIPTTFEIDYVRIYSKN